MPSLLKYRRTQMHIHIQHANKDAVKYWRKLNDTYSQVINLVPKQMSWGWCSTTEI